MGLRQPLNLLIHGKYSMYEPVQMQEETSNLFKAVLNEFLDKYNFHIPDIFA